MLLGFWVFVLWLAFMVVCGLLMFMWAKMTHQFDDIEAAKYQVLDEKEPEPWPGREPKQAKPGPTNTTGRK